MSIEVFKVMQLVGNCEKAVVRFSKMYPYAYMKQQQQKH